MQRSKNSLTLPLGSIQENIMITLSSGLFKNISSILYHDIFNLHERNLQNSL